MTTVNKSNKQTVDKLYKQYGKPLEQKHKGVYLAISSDGKKTMLGKTLTEIVQKAKNAFGSENTIFKIGQQSVGVWR